MSHFAFKFVGMIQVPGPLSERLEEIIIESGADDYYLEGDTVHIQTDWHKLSQIASFLKSE